MNKERKYLVEGEWVSESQIPEIFNLGNLLREYRKTVLNFGKTEADERFQTLLRKQLSIFIQEVVVQPLTPNFFYPIIQKENGSIEVVDPDYPQNPDLIERANPYLWYKLDEKATKEDLYDASPFAKVFIDRFLLEYEQIKVFIDEYLSADPLFAKSFIDQLAKATSPLEIRLEGGKTVEGYVSNWYTMAMPATKVHKGGGSYFYLLRAAAVPQTDGSFQYYLQKQGYFHKLKWNRQVDKLLNLDQEKTFIPKNEEEFMLRISQLKPHRNIADSEEVLTQIGKEAGDWGLPRRIKKARKRQDQQRDSIENAIKAILAIFEHELTQPESPLQDVRLKAFFEAIGNPLYFAKPIPDEEVIKSYYQTLAIGKDRDAFVSSLVTSIPSIIQQAAGWPLCGLFSAGGLAQNAQMVGGPHGFGGLDNCTVCPACGKISSGDVCGNKNCGFTRGWSLKDFAQKKHPPVVPKAVKNSARSASHSDSKPPSQLGIKLFATEESVSVQQGLFAQGTSITASQALSKMVGS